MKKITLITLLMSLISMSSWGQQCSANFSYSIIQNGTTASITNNSSLTTSFSFGDGTYYTATPTESFIHTYTVNGDYNVCALIIDSTQTPICSDTYCDSLSITGLSSSCNITASASYTMGANGTVTFTNTSSGANVVAFGGDDNLSEVYSGSFTHTYPSNGTYQVVVTAEDTLINGCQDVDIFNVIISNISNPTACQASYQWFQAYDSTTGAWMNQVYLVATTSGTNLSYSWSFGDGATANTQYPTHVYSNTGSYGVCLTITTGDSSCTQTYCDTVEVFSKAAGFTLNVVQEGSATSINEAVKTLTNQKVYPNPTAGNTTLNIDALEYTSTQINILDITGKIVMQQNHTLSIGNNSIELNTQNLTNGMYIISIQSENGNVNNLRLIKK